MTRLSFGAFITNNIDIGYIYKWVRNCQKNKIARRIGIHESRLQHSLGSARTMSLNTTIYFGQCPRQAL